MYDLQIYTDQQETQQFKGVTVQHLKKIPRTFYLLTSEALRLKVADIEKKFFFDFSNLLIRNKIWSLFAVYQQTNVAY